MQNNHKAFSANSWSVARKQRASWDKGAALGVIRNFIYFVTLGPGIVSPTWKETREDIKEKVFDLNSNVFRVRKDSNKDLLLPYSIATKELFSME